MVSIIIKRFSGIYVIVPVQTFYYRLQNNYDILFLTFPSFSLSIFVDCAVWVRFGPWWLCCGIMTSEILNWVVWGFIILGLVQIL